MNDRGQLTGTPIPVVASVVLIIAAMVAGEALSRLGVADPWRVGVFLLVLAAHGLIIREYYATTGSPDE